MPPVPIIYALIDSGTALFYKIDKCRVSVEHSDRGDCGYDNESSQVKPKK